MQLSRACALSAISKRLPYAAIQGKKMERTKRNKKLQKRKNRRKRKRQKRSSVKESKQTKTDVLNAVRK